jgi:hypothetical protein
VTPLAPSVRSEVGQLDAVLVHRPGEELRRVTPSNMERLLFDELLWVEHAQAEHDAFTDLLRSQGVEVLELTDAARRGGRRPGRGPGPGRPAHHRHHLRSGGGRRGPRARAHGDPGTSWSTG